MRAWIAALAAGLLLAGAARADEWGTDFEKAKARAVAESKPLLLDFTGSDWCGWCMKFDKEVFETPQFKAYAKANLVLVRLDFPQTKVLPPAEKAQNAGLAKKFAVTGYPTLLLVSADGGELFRQGGYTPGGPAPFLKALSRASPPQPQAKAPDAFDAFVAGKGGDVPDAVPVSDAGAKAPAPQP